MVDTDESDTDESDRIDENSRRIIAGWQGRYYEDFEVGDIYKHPYGQ